MESYKSLTNQVTGLGTAAEPHWQPYFIKVRVQEVKGVIAIIGITPGTRGVDCKELLSSLLSGHRLHVCRGMTQPAVTARKHTCMP